MSSRRSIPIVLCALLLAACGTPRKACRMAQRHVAKAVYLCPELLEAQHDTVYVTVPGDTVETAVTWAGADADSVLAACDSLRAAAEQLALLNIDRNRAMQRDLRRASDLLTAMDRLRAQACRVEDLHLERSDLTLHVWYDPVAGKLRAKATVRPRQLPCPKNSRRVITANAPCDPGVAPWYRTAFWSLLLVVVVALLARLSRWPKYLP